MFEWHLSGKTDTGRVREMNEDCILLNNEFGFAVLADGMGGHQGGEIASAMAVSGIAQDLSGAAGTLDSASEEQQSDIIRELLNKTICQINKEIYITAESKEQYKGMGTTVVVALCHNTKLFYAHVGDSRLYRLRDNELTQLTRDHSLVNELLEQGYYKTQQEADNAGQKNVITRAVGIANSAKVDVDEVEVQENDLFFLCSDGVSDMISDEIILECLQSSSDHEQVLMQIIEKSCAAGGRDNISAIIIQAQKGSLLKKSLSWLFKS